MFGMKSNEVNGRNNVLKSDFSSKNIEFMTQIVSGTSIHSAQNLRKDVVHITKYEGRSEILIRKIISFVTWKFMILWFLN